MSVSVLFLDLAGDAGSAGVDAAMAGIEQDDRPARRFRLGDADIADGFPQGDGQAALPRLAEQSARHAVRFPLRPGGGEGEQDDQRRAQQGERRHANDPALVPPLEHAPLSPAEPAAARANTMTADMAAALLRRRDAGANRATPVWEQSHRPAASAHGRGVRG